MSRLSCVGFDGKLKWQIKDYRPFGFDVDDSGNLYALNALAAPAIDKFATDGHLLKSIKLQNSDLRDSLYKYGGSGMRVLGSEAFIKLAHPTEMFEGYDLDSGNEVATVSIPHERFAVSYPSDSWIAGTAVPFTVEFSVPDNTPEPAFHVWAKPYGTTAYAEWPVTDGKLTVPVGAAGLYQLKITPEVRPLPYTQSEYILQSLVKIGQPGTAGTIDVCTPLNRYGYGRGEEIPFRVVVRSRSSQTYSVNVKLSDAYQVVAQLPARLSASTPGAYLLPASTTLSLKAGTYWLTATAANLSSVPQQIRLGPGSSGDQIGRIMYGDYGETFPDASVWTAADVADTHVGELDKLGVNTVVDRLGYPLETHAVDQFANTPDTAAFRVIGKALADDPVGIASEKAASETPLMQMSAMLGAAGSQQMAILLGNDAGLPAGTGLDPRKPSEFADAIKTVTDAYTAYPSMHGWSWASNWWVGPTGANSATGPDQRAAYLAAVKRANDTGAWDPVIDQVSARWLSLAPTAESTFGAQLKALNPRLSTAAAASYRNMYAWPPVTFSNVDEVDLQAQWEQIEVPFHAPFNVDFYSRPGKPAWGHPEIWNDSGTGDQVLPTLFEMAMRGASGVGESGLIPAFGYKPSDPRGTDQGLPSIYRALYETLKEYGPWLNTLQNDDQVAILADRREFMLDDWVASMPRHFANVAEAYSSCLLAHHAASIVFSDDITNSTLSRYKVLLIVGQTYELEPNVADALKTAQAKGLKVFVDSTCRPSVAAPFTQLGIAFDKFGSDRSQASDDNAYARFTGDARANVPAIHAALDKVAVPDATIDSGQGAADIFTTVRKSENARYLFLANETRPLSIGQGNMWRVGLLAANKLPVSITATISQNHAAGAAQVVYDVFGMRAATVASGAVNVDMVDMPMRIYAMLPKPIASIALRGPETVPADRPFTYFVRVLDTTGKPIQASVPVRVTFLSGEGNVLDTRYFGVGSAGVSGTFWTQRNVRSQTRSIVASELFSGITSRLDFPVAPGADATIATLASIPPPPSRVIATTLGKPVSSELKRAESRFGPHIKDMVVSGDGSLAIANTFNWNKNTYGIDTTTGSIKWQRQVGDYFAFAPVATKTGAAVQGFDFDAAEGYELYNLGESGVPTRAFALYGLPNRLTHRFVSSFLHDRIDNFVVAPDSSWIASAGDLGVAVWSQTGGLLWKRDDWSTNRSYARFSPASNWDSSFVYAPQLAVLDQQTLLVGDGSTLTGYRAGTGKTSWTRTLAENGHISVMRVSADGTTVAALSSADGGRVFTLRVGNDGAWSVIASIATTGDDLGLSPDGGLVAVTSGNQLRVYGTSGGLRWMLPGDDVLKYPRFSPDGKRIAATSVLGSVCVAAADGRVLLDRDLGAMSVPTWMPDGDLLIGTWMGLVERLDQDYRVKWRTLLGASSDVVPANVLATNSSSGTRLDMDKAAITPISRVDDWGNAAAKPAPLTPNLLALTHATISGSVNVRLMNRPETLYDGDPSPPTDPWLTWSSVNWFAETSFFNYVLLDSGNKTMHVTGITIAEDPAHPESWIRDAYLEAYSPSEDSWRFVQPWHSNAATHTHWLDKPVDTTRLRIVLPYGVPGNLRMGEIVVHGTLP